MNRELATNFLFICRQCYFEKITPANPLSYSNPLHQRLIEIVKEFFNNNQYEEFAEFLKEGQYFVDLWTAHLLLEHGSPNNIIKIKALNTIVHNLDNTLSPQVSNEEKFWLDNSELIIKRN